VIVELSPGDRRPLFLQVADSIHAAIIRGDLRPGDPVPSVRALGQDAGVHANTILHAYRELAARGAVESRRGRGTFVNAIPFGQAERRVLADEVAERALRDAVSHGLTPRDLTAALDRAERHRHDHTAPGSR
jgi:DNA-binding transcriptional regulator YhcF (GntR family)